MLTRISNYREPSIKVCTARETSRAALCDVQLEWLFKNMLPAPPVHLWTKGEPQSEAPPRTLRATLCDTQLHFLETHMMPTPPVRIWAKGQQQCDHIRTLLPAHMVVCDLETLSYPGSVRKLMPNKEKSTVTKAKILAKWYSVAFEKVNSTVGLKFCVFSDVSEDCYRCNRSRPPSLQAWFSPCISCHKPNSTKTYYNSIIRSHW
ncbi:hypothetical protein OS493_005966 [Desmophyllum pertusum]|uniref:Uncharacterized protein n=1 Tax=Desmophyllum pertusum TaxID=174260 RepID=A0A9X0CGM9_9CNID|nr:hypothetical protein OS493_005966 [Desmophyllum pertusum]